MSPTQHVILRGRDSGVHAGYIVGTEKIGETEFFIVERARRLWRWCAVGGISLSDLAQNGLDYGRSKISCEATVRLRTTDVSEVISTTAAGGESIRNAPVAQNTVS